MNAQSEQRAMARARAAEPYVNPFRGAIQGFMLLIAINLAFGVVVACFMWLIGYEPPTLEDCYRAHELGGRHAVERYC